MIELSKRLHVVLLEPEDRRKRSLDRPDVRRGGGDASGWSVRSGFRLDDRYLRRAGLDYWPHLNWRVVNGLDEVVTALGRDRLWFVTPRPTGLHGHHLPIRRRPGLRPREPRPAAHWLDDRPTRLSRIPIRPEARGLNLANAVAIAVFESRPAGDIRQMVREDLICGDGLHPPCIEGRKSVLRQLCGTRRCVGPMRPSMVRFHGPHLALGYVLLFMRGRFAQDHAPSSAWVGPPAVRRLPPTAERPCPGRGITCGTVRRSRVPANRRPCRRAVPGWRCASWPWSARPVPMLLARREPDHVAGMDLLDRAALPLDPAAAGRDDQGLPQRMGVPGRPGPGLERDAGTGRTCRGVCLEQRVDADRAGEPVGRSFAEG